MSTRRHWGGLGVVLCLAVTACGHDDDPAPPPVETPAPPPAPPPAPALPVRAAIDVGGSLPVVAAGVEYAADAFVTGGTAVRADNPVSGTPHDGLYQSERRGEFAYAVPLTDGPYRVTLQFVESAGGPTLPGQRVFDVVLEAGELGEQRLADLDVRAVAGPSAAYDVTRTVEVRGGTLDLRTVRRVGDPTLSAIRAVPASEDEPVVIPARVLRDEALRALAGSAEVQCADSPGIARRVEIGDGFVALGDQRTPFEGLLSLDLTASADRSLEAVVTVPPAGSGASMRFVLDGAGRLTEAAIRAPDAPGGQETRCTPVVPAAWGAYRGDARAFVDGIEKPRPGYPTATLSCELFPSAIGNTYRGPANVRSAEYVLQVESEPAGLARFEFGMPWLDPALEPVPAHAYRLRLAGDRGVAYHRTDADALRGPFRTLSMETDANRTLTGAGYASMSVRVGCSVPAGTTP